MEYYLPFKRKEILIHATTWVNLENITLSKISQTERTVSDASIYMMDTEEANS